MKQTHVAVVGGGMVGASLALLLADALPDRNIQLLEAQPFEGTQGTQIPSFDARSTALSPTSMALMQRLRLWDQLQPFTTAITQIHVSDRGQPGGLRMTAADNAGAPLGYVVENTGLGQVLMEAVRSRANLEVRAPASVLAIKPKARGVELDCGAGGAVPCELAVVANGADSHLRRALHIDELVRDYHQFAVVANVACAKPHGGTAYERFTADGPMALLPRGGADGSTCAMVLTCARHDVGRLRAMSDQDFLQHLQSRFGYRLGYFTHISKRLYYPLKLRLAREQVRAGIVLMGNAAHFLHPVAGQGFNLAARDCARLAHVLRQRQDGEALGSLRLLQNYEQLQRGDQDLTVLLSHGFNELFRLPGAGFGALRGLGFLSLEVSGALRQGFIRQLSGKAFARPSPILPT